MTTVLFLDLFSGASGDMLLGALLDAGLPLAELKVELAKMDLSGYELEEERQVRHGLSGTKLHVRDVAQAHPARHLSDVHKLIRESTLSDRVQAVSMAAFERLARAEAHIHGMPIDHVHFHEVGAVDSVVDIVGFAAGLERLEVERVFASPVPLGSGTIRTEHGQIPVPAPATLALLAEAQAPTRPHPAQTEIVTPTAAALLAELATFKRPPMRVRAIGYGFGQKDFPWANAVRAWLGEIEGPTGQGGQTEGKDQVVLLECNLDDISGEVLGYAMEQLFAAGALDAWFTPIHMKKNRPATVLSVLARPEQSDPIAQIALRETSTLGLRVSTVDRIVAERRMREVETPWGKVRIKEKWLAGERTAISPEYEDCARIARAQSIPLHQVFDAARKTAQ
jgi:uncharacterized protein (TIGR00299 family) protein